nr:hypothetical protein [Tanacetum cinerariifolium]
MAYRQNVSRDTFSKSTEFSADDYDVLVAHSAPFQKFSEPFLCLIEMSRNYTLDEDTYPTFLCDDGTGGCLSLYIVQLVVFELVFDYLFIFVEMDLSAFIQVADPTKVKVREQERAEEEARLLDSTIERVVPLLPIAPARSDSELEASVERLFDEGGSADQGDSAAGGGQDAGTGLATGVKIVVAGDVAAEKPKRPRKKRQAVTDASGSFHPPKKLRGDYGTSGEVATSSKSPSALRELLVSSMLNVEAGVTAVTTFPMVTSSLSATPEHESGAPIDSITWANLCTIGASERFVISSDSSHHSGINASGPEDDSIVKSVVIPPVITEAVVTSHAVTVPSVSKTGAKVTSPVHASLFQDSDSTETVKADVAGPSYSARQDLSMGSRKLDVETPHQVFVSQWNVLNDSLLDDYDVSREFVDQLAPLALFSQIREMDYHHLFTKFNVGTARQACFNEEVRMRTEYCLSERKRLESECEKQADLLKARDEEVEKLKAQLLLKETEAAEATYLRAQVSAVKATKKIHTNEIYALKQKNVTFENEKESLDGKVAELQSSVSTKDLELKDLNVAVSSLRSQKDGLVDQVHALETTCSGLCDQFFGYERLKKQIEESQDVQMNIVNDKVAKLDVELLEMAFTWKKSFTLTSLPLYLVGALGAAISRAIEKGMQDGLSAGIDHGKAGRSLADVVAYNPTAKADYNSALQRLHEVDLSLLAELKSHKDVSVKDIMNLLRLEGPLVDAPRMNDLQPCVDQFMLHVHWTEDQVVLGETSLSFALSVTHSEVEKIRENVAAKRSALIGVWTHLVDLLSVENLVGESDTSEGVPTIIATTNAMSTTFASASSVPPITIEDYEIVGTDGPDDAQGSGQGNVTFFPTVEYEKEELDTTPEHDLPC